MGHLPVDTPPGKCLQSEGNVRGERAGALSHVSHAFSPGWLVGSAAALTLGATPAFPTEMITVAVEAITTVTTIRTFTYTV